MFLKTERFPFSSRLEQRWRAVREELQGVPAEAFAPWHEKHLYTNDWRVFGLYAFGRRIESHARLCPETVRLLEEIPGLYNAGFSALRSGTWIKPHRGYTPALLRCHLGLIVPNECGLRVAQETRDWQEGKCLIFDDTAEHEAWNRSREERVVLLVDFRNPEAGFSLLDRAKIAAMRLIARRYLK